MSAQHTPGPWVARPDPNACLPDDWCVGTGPENIDKVAVCSKCDAHLIAAAPDLLAALKRIEGASMSMYATRSDMLEDCQDIARAAIQKAEGK